MTLRVLLFGASGGIGSAVHQALTDQGMLVEVPSREECDLSDSESISRYLNTVETCPNHIVFAAGINNPSPVSALGNFELGEIMQVNFFSMAQILLHFAHGQTQIPESSNVAVSSLYSQAARTGRAAYSASKAALEAFFRSMAIEQSRREPFPVRYNVVQPGFIETRMTRRNNSKREVELLENAIPMGKLGSPDDVSEAIKYLLSPDSAYVTGTVLRVDGGIFAQA